MALFMVTLSEEEVTDMEVTKMTTSIGELKNLNDTEVYYRIHERIEDYALSIGDIQLAIAEKWHMAALNGGSL